MTIATILKNKGHEVTSVPATMTVTAVVALLAQQRIGAVPVTEDGTVAGVFSERDVIIHLSSKSASALDLPVSALMTSPAVTVSSETDVLAALSLMTRRRIRHLPVVDDGKLVGFVSIGDLVKHRIDRIEAEADAMRDYIQGA